MISIIRGFYTGLILLFVGAVFALSAHAQERISSVEEDPGARSEAEMAEQKQDRGNYFGVLNGLGLHVGPVLSTTSSSNSVTGPEYNSRFRLMFGANAEIGLGWLFYFQPEINYIQRGFDYQTTSGNTLSTLEANLNYLEVPLLLKIMPHSGAVGSIQPYALAGPSLAFLISRSATARETSGASTRTFIDSASESAFAGVMLGMNFGAGVNYALSSGANLTLDLRYALGLTNIETTVDGRAPERTHKTDTVQIMTGVQFLL